MRILITGANGQLGHSLQDTAPAGHEIVATDVHNLNLCDAAETAKGLRNWEPDLIINTAAYTAVDKAETEADLAQQINGDAVGRVADYCEQFGCRLIHISTDFVFSGDERSPRKPGDPPAPASVYGITKLAGERATLETCRNSRVIRTSWVYSEHGSNFVKTMLKLAAGRSEISVVDDQIGSPTYARNLAGAIWTLMNIWPDEPLLHYSDAGEVSWFGFAEAVFAEAKELNILAKGPTVSPISTADYQAPAPRPAYSVMDTSLTSSALGITPPPWRSALRDMLARSKNTSAD